MRMFSCAASWRNRSSRALECSGPLPSYPCGSSRVSRDVSRHFDRPGRHELVDDDLRAVHEVSELRLPQHERLGRCGGVAVLEADARVLRERRVVDLERRGRLVEMLHRRERRAGVHVVQNRVAVRERAPLGVLAGDPDGDAVDEQRCERERFRLAPVDAALVERRATALELRPQLRMRREPIGNAQKLLVERRAGDRRRRP